MALSVACLVITTVVSKVFDRAVNVLAEDFGILPTLSIRSLVTSQEEILQPTLLVIAGMALWQCQRARRRCDPVRA